MAFRFVGMNRIDRSVLVPTSIILIMLLSVWLGVAGAVISDAEARGFWKFVEAWQSLLTGVLAIGAAVITVKPVWRQLSELQAQSAAQAYEILRQQTLVVEADAQLAWSALSEAHDSEGILKLIADQDFEIRQIFPTFLAFCDERLSRQQQLVSALEAASVHRWGTANIQTARHELIVSVMQLRMAVIDIKRTLIAIQSRHKSPDPTSRQWLVDKKRLKDMTLATAREAVQSAFAKYIVMTEKETTRLRDHKDRALTKAVTSP
jgi:hypothetical protein